MKAECIKSFGQFIEGDTYKVVENQTMYFKIMSLNGKVSTFSKVYDDEYPNFRKYFIIK